MTPKITDKEKKLRRLAQVRKAVKKHYEKNKHTKLAYLKKYYQKKVKPKNEAKKLIIKGLQILERLKKTR